MMELAVLHLIVMEEFERAAPEDFQFALVHVLQRLNIECAVVVRACVVIERMEGL